MGPTKAYISHPNLKYNIQLIRNAVGSRKIMAVVKANAYGHGAVEVAQTALNAGCEYLGVAFAEEGLQLRKAGITAPILVFGAQLQNDLQLAVENRLEVTVSHPGHIKMLELIAAKTNKKISIHLKIDTGMNRAGFDLKKYQNAFKNILKNQNFELVGVYSHLSSADEPDTLYTQKQIDRFCSIVEFVKSNTKKKINFHLCNSAGIMKYPQAYFDMVRPGIMLYGQLPSPDFKTDWQLKEVMSLRSRLTQIKLISKDEPISYSRRFFTKEDCYIGLIPAGYADGISRKLSNNTDVIINKKRHPQVGTICMDMLMVNLGKNTDCKIGDEVIFYGGGKNEFISISEIARKLKTISYEITCNVSSRVVRVHLNE